MIECLIYLFHSALQQWFTLLQIYLKASDCVFADVGDRLGMFWEDSTSVPYTHDDNKKAYVMKHDSFSIAVGEQMQFGTELQPYAFPLSAYLDTSKKVLSNRESALRTSVGE